MALDSQYRGHRPASPRGPLKGLGIETAEVAVSSGSIVERLDVVEDIGPHAQTDVAPLRLSWLHIQKPTGFN